MRRELQSIDGLDPRLVLKIYPWVLVGLLVTAGHVSGERVVTLVGTDRIRELFGLSLLAMLFWSSTIAMVERPKGRRRALGVFAAFHALIVLTITVRAGHALMHTRGGFWLLTGIMGVTVALAYTWAMANGDPRPGWHRVVDLFGRGARTPTQHATSDYEDRIRAAAAQEERNRLARELHDSIKQQVFAIHTAAATAETRLLSDPAGAEQALAQVRDSARDAMTEMDAMLDQMRAGPLGNDSLVDALRKQSEALRLRTGAEVSFSFGTLPAEHAVSSSARQALVRAAQESLANVAKHARAKHVRVTLDVVAGEFVLTVADDGTGYDQEQSIAGMGLVGMRTRADECGGSFSIVSGPARGTTVRFAVPIVSAPTRELRSMALIAGVGVVILLLLSLKIGHVAWVMLPLPVLEFARLTLAWRRARKTAGAAARSRSRSSTITASSRAALPPGSSHLPTCASSASP